jgi:hypothetical protein
MGMAGTMGMAGIMGTAVAGASAVTAVAPAAAEGVLHALLPSPFFLLLFYFNF